MPRRGGHDITPGRQRVDQARGLRFSVRPPLERLCDRPSVRVEEVQQRSKIVGLHLDYGHVAGDEPKGVRIDVRAVDPAVGRRQRTLNGHAVREGGNVAALRPRSGGVVATPERGKQRDDEAGPRTPRGRVTAARAHGGSLEADDKVTPMGRFRPRFRQADAT